MKLRRNSGICTSLVACLAVVICSCSSGPKGPTAIDADAPEEFTTTESGLKYRILRKSDGRKPRGSDKVTVDYAGWLDNGTVFDSSYERQEPAEFALYGVVKGYAEGLQLIGEGGMIELEIPAELGYGESDRTKIPANSTLHFKIELHEIL